MCVVFRCRVDLHRDKGSKIWFLQCLFPPNVRWTTLCEGTGLFACWENIWRQQRFVQGISLVFDCGVDLASL